MPPLMLPGMGGGPPPAMAGMGVPGMGASPFGGAPDASLAAMDRLSQMPQGQGETQMLIEATSMLQAALGRVMLRSPKAAKALSEGITKIQLARETIEAEAQAPLPPPPDFLGSMNAAPMGSPGLAPAAAGTLY